MYGKIINKSIIVMLIMIFNSNSQVFSVEQINFQRTDLEGSEEGYVETASIDYNENNSIGVTNRSDGRLRIATIFYYEESGSGRSLVPIATFYKTNGDQPIELYELNHLRSRYDTVRLYTLGNGLRLLGLKHSNGPELWLKVVDSSEIAPLSRREMQIAEMIEEEWIFASLPVPGDQIESE